MVNISIYKKLNNLISYCIKLADIKTESVVSLWTADKKSNGEWDYIDGLIYAELAGSVEALHKNIPILKEIALLNDPDEIRRELSNLNVELNILCNDKLKEIEPDSIVSKSVKPHQLDGLKDGFPKGLKVTYNDLNSLIETIINDDNLY